MAPSGPPIATPSYRLRRRRRTDLHGFQRDNNVGEVDADDGTDHIPTQVLLHGQRESYAYRDIPYHGIDARRMQRAGYGRESTDWPEPRMWRRRRRLERLVAARSMCRRSYCPGLEDFTRAVEAPSTGRAAMRSASAYRLSPARRCEREAGRAREQRPRSWLWVESVSALSQKQTFRHELDDVRFRPEADIGSSQKQSGERALL